MSLKQQQVMYVLGLLPQTLLDYEYIHLVLTLTAPVLFSGKMRTGEHQILICTLKS